MVKRFIRWLTPVFLPLDTHLLPPPYPGQGMEMRYRLTMTNGDSYWYKHFSADEFCEYYNNLHHSQPLTRHHSLIRQTFTSLHHGHCNKKEYIDMYLNIFLFV